MKYCIGNKVVENFFRNYGVSVKYLFLEVQSGVVAYTDGDQIIINPDNHITASFSELLTQYKSIAGLKGHEVGHILYTDFSACEEYYANLLNGVIYPEDPKHKNAQALKDFVYSKEYNIVSVAMDINNILEDLYVEYKIHTNPKLSPYFSQALLMNNRRMFDLAPNAENELKQNRNQLIALFNLLLKYCKSESFCDTVPPEYEDVFEEMKAVVDNHCFSDNPLERIKGTNEIMCVLFPYIEKYLMMDDEEQEKLLKQLSLDDFIGLFGTSSGISDQEKSRVLGDSSGESQEKSDSSQQSRLQDLRNAVSQLAQKNQNDNSDVSWLLQEGSEKSLSSAAELLKTLPSQNNEFEEEQVSKQMQREWEQYDKKKDELHANVAFTITYPFPKKRTVDLELYNLCFSQTAPEVRRNQRVLAERVVELQNTGKKYSVFGQSYKAQRSFRKDLTCFQTKQRELSTGLSVCLLIDMSGSMGSDGRVESAQKAAISLYEFIGGIPGMEIGIYGFNTNNVRVGGSISDCTQIVCLCDFERRSEMDKVRLVKEVIPDHYNRDGHAIGLCCEKLLTRSHDNKLFILISDGQPNAWNYSGVQECVKKELVGLRKKYSKLGVKFVVAAIGDDKDRLRELYGEKNFCDIKNLKALPRVLVNICEEMILENM